MVYILSFVFLILGLLAMLPLKINKLYKQIYVIIGVVLFLIAGFRGAGVDRDYLTYVNLYHNIGKLTILSVEPTFIIISDFVKYVLFNNVVFVFVIYAIMAISLKLYAIKQLSDFYFFSVLVYFSNFFILQELTQIRVGIAAGILLLCIKPLYDRNLRKFLILSILAFLFHYSAIVVFPLWFFSKKSFQKIIYLSLISISYILYFLHFDFVGLLKFIPIDILQVRIDKYIMAVNTGLISKSNINVFSSIQILRIFMLVLITLNVDIIKEKNKYIYILLKVYVFALISLVLLSSVPPIAFRISDLLLITEIILIPNIIYIFKPSLLGKLVVFCFSLLQIFISLFYLKLISL